MEPATKWLLEEAVPTTKCQGLRLYTVLIVTSTFQVKAIFNIMPFNSPKTRIFPRVTLQEAGRDATYTVATCAVVGGRKSCRSSYSSLYFPNGTQNSVLFCCLSSLFTAGWTGGEAHQCMQQQRACLRT